MKPYRQIEIFSGITRNIFIMGMVSLFTDLSSQLVRWPFRVDISRDCYGIK